MTNSARKIAMIGMYGGYYRGDYNPGCIMICLKTRQELLRRIGNCEIDVYSIDTRAGGDEIVQEHKDGLDIHFFPASQGASLLNTLFARYDALVIGGDVVWSEYFENNGLFFLDSETFLASQQPLVLFNCVHRFNPVKHKAALFRNIEKRSAYIAVRTEFLKNELNEIGVGSVKAIPDPVLDLELKKTPKAEREKPLIGISVSQQLSQPLITILQQSDLSGFDICFYPYSRQYHNLATVQAMQKVFGDRFSYITEYKDPVATFEMIAGFDISVSDTYHGTIAALIQHVPFVCINTEPPASSRITHLLKPFGLQHRIVSTYPNPGESDADTFNRCLQEFNALINEPPRVEPAQLKAVKQIIQQHFDHMARIIMAG